MAEQKLRKSDLAVAGLIVAISAMLLVPLPTTLLDLLLVANLSFAFVLLITALYLPSALSLLAFPTLLLLTTLFRLSLNVASTRLILSQGEAGAVISTFGTLLIGSEIIVGIIIFAIITTVNFVVIAKGSSRVSEVAARFALDALPGKQMAIDADLRSGLIDARQAQEKREDLRKESQLYGAMDGAMKFVQGDAIAGIIIIFTNVLAGLYMGMVNTGLSFAEAARTYTTLTVGDGLVHQIPALLISICAGVVVTRVSSGGNTTLGRDLGEQLFNRPGVLFFSALLLVLLGVVAGLPTVPFLVVGGALAGFGLLLRRDNERKGAGKNQNELSLGGSSPLALPGPEGGAEEVVDSILVLELDQAILYRVYRLNIGRYRSWWREFQQSFFDDTGLRLPELSVQPSNKLSPGGYSWSCGGSEVGRGEALLDKAFVEVTPEYAVALGLDEGTPTKHPLSGGTGMWIGQTSLTRRVLEAADIRSYDFFEYLCLKMGVFFLAHPEELLTVAEVHSQLKIIEKKHPGLLADAFGSEGVNVARLTELLLEMVREGVSLRDFRGIIEHIATYCSTRHVSLGGEEDFDHFDLIRMVRVARKRHLLAKVVHAHQRIRAVTLGDDVRSSLEEAAIDEQTGVLSLDPEIFSRVRDRLKVLLEPIFLRGLQPVTFLCEGTLRHKLSKLLRMQGVNVVAIAFEELEGDHVIEPLGIVSLK